jgi:beta-mannosidase
MSDEERDIVKTDYLRINEDILPSLLKIYGPDTFYWPSSPSSGGGFDHPNSPDRGDSHYWDVWHRGKPFTEYRSYFFRYASEFGFQSFPCLKTITSFTLPEDRNIFLIFYVCINAMRRQTGK